MQYLKNNSPSPEAEGTRGQIQKRPAAERLRFALRRDWQLYVLILLPALYILIFCYLPMGGIQLAFRNYRAADGIFGSKWVWFDNFIRFFRSYQFTRVLKNTLILSLYSFAVGMTIPIAFALIFHCIELPRFKKITQSIVTLPHFISVVVLVSMVMQFLNSRVGLYGILYESVTGTYPSDLFGKPSAFRHIYVWSGVWQNFGWSAIIYIATLSGVDYELHEAAQLDGASRFQRVLHVDFPHIAPTVVTLGIMRVGHLLSVGFEKVLLLQNSLNREYSEVISTYVYQVGLAAQMKPDYSYAMAVGLFNSVINLILITLANRMARRLSDTSLW